MRFRRKRGRLYRCARSRIVLGLNQSHDHTLYFSNRIFLTLACRGFYLTHYVPGMEQVFKDGVHLAWFKSLDECIDKIDFYLAHDELRDQIAAAGHEVVTAEHGYSNRVSEILSILRNEKPVYCPDTLRPLDEPVLHPSTDSTFGRSTGSTNT